MGDVKWTAELEVALFHSMHGHKPVGKITFTTAKDRCASYSRFVYSLCAGLNKHFHMACIQWRLQQRHSISLSTQQIRQHLNNLYDLKTLVGVGHPLSRSESLFSAHRTVLRSFHFLMRRRSSTCLTLCWSASWVSPLSSVPCTDVIQDTLPLLRARDIPPPLPLSLPHTLPTP